MSNWFFGDFWSPAIAHTVQETALSQKKIIELYMSRLVWQKLNYFILAVRIEKKQQRTSKISTLGVGCQTSVSPDYSQRKEKYVSKGSFWKSLACGLGTFLFLSFPLQQVFVVVILLRLTYLCSSTKNHGNSQISSANNIFCWLTFQYFWNLLVLILGFRQDGLFKQRTLLLPCDFSFTFLSHLYDMHGRVFL